MELLFKVLPVIGVVLLVVVIVLIGYVKAPPRHGIHHFRFP